MHANISVNLLHRIGLTFGFQLWPKVWTPSSDSSLVQICGTSFKISNQTQTALSLWQQL